MDKFEWYVPAVKIISVVFIIKFISAVTETEGEEGREKQGDGDKSGGGLYSEEPFSICQK